MLAALAASSAAMTMTGSECTLRALLCGVCGSCGVLPLSLPLPLLLCVSPLADPSTSWPVGLHSYRKSAQNVLHVPVFSKCLAVVGMWEGGARWSSGSCWKPPR
jgi:hypothetical protein